MVRAIPGRLSADERVSDARYALGVAAATLLLYIVPIVCGIPYSVGIVGGLRILDGDIPYRDFWTMYSPGHFYFLAALFGLFGRHLIVANVAKALVVAASSGILFMIARDMKVRRDIAIAVALLSALVPWKTGYGLSTYEPALLFILLAWWLSLRAEGNDRVGFAAGLAIGTAAWFKHDIAAFAGVALAAALVFDRSTDLRVAGWRAIVRDVLALAAGAALVVVPGVLWFWAVAGPDAWRDLIVFPATDFRKLWVQREFPMLLPHVSGGDRVAAVEQLTDWLRFDIPILVWIGAAFALVRARARGRSHPGLAVLVATLPLFFYAAHVHVSTHIYTITLITLLLGGMAWSAADAVLTRRARLLGRAIAAAYVVCLLFGPAKSAAGVLRDLPASRFSTIPSLKGLLVPARDLAYYEPIARLVQSETRPDDRIYVGMSRHDVVIQSNPMVYAVVGRRGPSRYDELHPAVAAAADVQQEIADAIADHDVRVVLLWNFGAPKRLFEETKIDRMRVLPGSGSEVLDRYLARTYQPVARYGEYSVLLPRSAALSRSLATGR